MNRPKPLTCYPHDVIKKTFLHFYFTEEGEIINLKTGEIKYTWLNQGRASQYEKVQFSINGKRQNFLVSRIQALLYLTDFDDSLEVNHNDENTLNNHWNNLSMRSHTDNLLDYYQNKATQKVVYKYLRNSRCVFKEGVIKVFNPLAITKGEKNESYID